MNPAEPQGRYRMINLAVFCALMGTIFLLKQARSEKDAVYLWGWRTREICMYKILTGRNCYGCGITRGVVAFLDGDKDRAKEMHPSSVCVAVWLMGQAVTRLLCTPLVAKVVAWWPVDVGVSTATLLGVVYIPLVTH